MAEGFSYPPTMTQEQREALGWVLDLAYDDQQHYLDFGNPPLDYGEEWPEVAKQRAMYCRLIAAMAGINGEYERWTALAEEYEGTTVEEELTVDPNFVAILAKNVQFFLEHGHGEEENHG